VLVDSQIGSEIKAASISGTRAVAEAHPPDTGDDDRIPGSIAQCAQEGAIVRIESINLAISEITDQQIVAERAEIRRG
jgi:hypothetical protein